MLRLSGVVAVMVLLACGRGADGEVEIDDSLELSEAELATTPSIKFKTTGIEVTGTPTQGKKVRVSYQSARLPDCRGTNNNGTPAWSITGHASLNGGTPKSFLVAGHSPTGKKLPTSHFISLPEEGELQIWFEVTNRWGCQAWDSNFGQNHRFAVASNQPNSPDWVGDAIVNISRSGGGCDGGGTLGESFSFGTWARSRAAETLVCFEAWEPGVTDFANPDLWKQLDARIYYRWGDGGAFTHEYVSLEGRTGNNARYSVELRGFDPFRLYQTGCPEAPLAASADGQYVQAELQFYFEVNGKRLSPTPITTYSGHFEDYASQWAHCL